jgi:hypothetical protein
LIELKKRELAICDLIKSRHGVKDTGRRDECHGGLLFPPERGEHGPAFE